jgi:hypothetical protein
MSYHRIWVLPLALISIGGSNLLVGEVAAPSSLSPDGKLVVFVRPTPNLLVETSLGQDEATEIWTAGVDGGAARMRLRGHFGSTPAKTLAGFKDARFSPDGQRVLFLSDAWVTSRAVHVLDLRSNTERFLCSGNSLEVIYRGKYSGYLMVCQHRYAMGGGSYDWLWLVTPEGADAGLISMDDDAATERFRKLYKIAGPQLVR